MSALEDAPSYRLGAGSSPRAEAGGAVLMRILRGTPWAVCAITAVAAALRLAQLGAVSPNDFYDAAVRSMSISWHNFFFGAFDPGAALSLDKPPVDLWLQVGSVRLFGFGSVALKLPEALGGTLAVPLLYDVVRRAVGRGAGLATAAALAVLPESVLTSRSDTMDSVMMLLVIVALWLTIRAVGSGRRRPLLVAGAALGLAFEVKLLEALIVAPALVVLYWLATQAPWRRKLKDLALAGLALLVVGLAWPIAVSLAPGRHPWSVGSSDGTVWSAMFVFNGFGKVSSAAGAKPGGPGLFRLVVSTGWHYDVLFGCVLVSALAIGTAAVLASIHGSRVRPREARPPEARPSAARPSDARPPHGGAPEARPPAAERARLLTRAFLVSLAVWIAVGVVLFDAMGTVHARYLEALAPALAAAIGCGAISLAGMHQGRRGLGTPSVIAFTVALVGVCAYTLGLPPPSVGWAAAALILSAVGAGLVARAGGPLGAGAKWMTAALILACALVFPAHESLSLMRSAANDSLGLATTSQQGAAALSRYLRPRTADARYELAVDEPLALAPLIIRDRRPILPLTSFAGRPLVGLRELRAAVQSGAVGYGLVGGYRCGPSNARAAACGVAAAWIRHNGVDVSSAAGLRGRSRLYRLSSTRAGLRGLRGLRG